METETRQSQPVQQLQGQQTPQYHHGLTIKEYRLACNMTQLELAERWPGSPVNARYIQKVESGEKRISDQELLRELAAVLSVPLWRFGLSEYNPFNPRLLSTKGERMHDDTLQTVQLLVDTTWYMRRTAPVPETERNTTKLLQLFASLASSLPPTEQLEKQFLRLYAQTQRLHAIMLIERQQYGAALLAFNDMLRIAEALGESSTTALALMGIGTELERAGRQLEAVDRLEQARDISFQASRQVAALINAYLARAYASNKDAIRFNRAIDTAENIATTLGDAYGNGEDYVFHRISGILAERSYGYLEIGEPRKVLDLRPSIVQHIDVTRNTWLHAWMPLDWAQAYLQLKEVEESVREGREFFERTLRLQSPHAISRAYKHLRQLEAAGYAKVPAVRDFRDELRDKQP